MSGNCLNDLNKLFDNLTEHCGILIAIACNLGLR